MRTRSTTIGRLAFLVVLVAAAATTPVAMAGLATGPTTSPAATEPDAGTLDALRDIGAVAAPPPDAGSATDRPADAGVEPSRVDTSAEAGGLRHWWDLVAFFAPVLVVAGAVGVSGGVVGTFVLLRREALLALALPQVVAVGAAVGLRNGWPTLPPAMVAAAVGLGYVVWTRRAGGGGRSADAARMAVPALYVAGLCVSFLVIAGSGAHVEELQKLFTGIDVAVAPGEAAVVAPVLLAAAALCAALWRRWLLLAQTPAAAELAGMSPARSDALFLSLLTVVLLLGTNSQGVVMVLAMLFLPAAVVQPWTTRGPDGAGGGGRGGARVPGSGVRGREPDGVAAQPDGGRRGVRRDARVAGCGATGTNVTS